MRYAGTALIAGGAALLVLIIVLWRMTRVPADAASSRVPVASESPIAEDHATTIASKPAATPATARGGRSGTVQIPGAPAPSGAPSSAPSSPPSVPEAPVEKKRVPIASQPVLREAVATLDGAVADCVRRFGQGVTGIANLSFIAAPNKGHVDIESTGVIEEGTTITNQDLLECMHKTALTLKFPFVADATAVFARRVAKLDNGKLSEQYLLNFSYIP